MNLANRRFYLLAVLVLLVVGFLRFYRVADLGYFMLDEERDAFLVRRMLVEHRPLLIGGAIPGGINVGPLFFYISAIPYALSNLNPVGPAGAAAIIGVIGVIGVFVVGKELFGRRTGLLAAVFAGFSLVNIVYQRPWWPLTMSQLVTLITYLALFKLSKGQVSIRWPMVLVGTLIFGAQSDPSTLSLIPLSIIWLWWKRKQTKLSGKLVVAMIGVFLLAHTTWFVFEFRHDFLNTRAGVGLLSGVFKGPTLASAKVGPSQTLQMTSAMLYRLFIPTGSLDVTKQISPAEEFLRPRLNGIWWPGAWGLLIGIGIYVICAFKGPALLWQGRALISIHFLISLSGILIYTFAFPGYVHEWMWAFMFPSFFLMMTDILIWLFYKAWPWVTKARPLLTLSVCAWVIWQLFLFSRLTNIAGLGVKLKIVQEAQTRIAGHSYELRSEGQDSLRYGGWRYLFALSGNPPVKSYMDYVYQGWVYPKNEVEPEIVVAVNNLRDKTAMFTLSEN